ncbi:MAG TPA: hypothetical protein VJZ00_06620 [Thermoanaerobaculia bacterium]|nr:hypothetical protein [Thermoanaerobaculia bacterium]
MRRVVPLLLAALSFVLLGILWIVTDRRASQRVYDSYSSANTSEYGVSLAAGYLAKHRKVAMLTRSLARTPVERNAVIFRMADRMPIFFDPETLDEKEIGPPKPKERPLLNDAEQAFVRNGGRMIVGVRAGLLSAAEIEETTIQKVFPIWPAVKDPQPKIHEREKLDTFTALSPRMLVILASATHPILARERMGRGEVFVFSAPQVLQNEQLATGTHLALLAALAGEGRPVYFDEVPHGIISDEGALALMKDWNLGPFLVLLAAFALLVFWRGGRRIGPPDEDYRETRSDAIDLVHSLGALYRDVTSDADAIALYHDALTRTVAHQTGLRGDALRKRVDELTGNLVVTRGTGAMPQGVFGRQLDILNNAFIGVTKVSKSSSRKVSKEAL